jgi:two-component system LytT family response regulator
MKESQQFQSQSHYKQNFSGIHLLYSQIPQDRIPASEPIKKKMAIPTSNGVVLVALSDIIYLKAEGNYTRIFTAQHKRYMVSKTLKHFHEKMRFLGFERIHQSYLINTDHISCLRTTPAYEIQLTEGSVVPVSRSHRTDIKNYLLTQYTI